MGLSQNCPTFFVSLGVLKRPLYILSLLAILVIACQAESTTESQTETPTETSTKFEAFRHFPKQQFETLSLGITQEQLTQRIKALPVNVIAANENHHYYFEKDSTELIIPHQNAFTEFKLFLRSSQYLNQTTALKALFESAAFTTKDHPIFPSYEYQSDSLHFNLTYFEQPEAIRLHFKLISRRG